MKPSQHFVGSNFELPPLPPGSALKFAREAEAEQRFPSLLSNLEGEMARLLEWASAGDAKVAPRRQGGLRALCADRAGLCCGLLRASNSPVRRGALLARRRHLLL